MTLAQFTESILSSNDSDSLKAFSQKFNLPQEIVRTYGVHLETLKDVDEMQDGEDLDEKSVY